MYNLHNPLSCHHNQRCPLNCRFTAGSNHPSQSIDPQLYRYQPLALWKKVETVEEVETVNGLQMVYTVEKVDSIELVESWIAVQHVSTVG